MRVAVIPARGGSKRLPRKNIRSFLGRPMIAYSIECARQSGLFDRIIVSTDDDEIARVATSFGAEVPFRRPRELSDDYCGTVEVVAHSVGYLAVNGCNPAEICCLYATAPFLRPEDLVEGHRLLEGGGWSYVFAATSFAAPVSRGFQKLACGKLEMFFGQHYETRSQDLPEALHDAGQFYWGRPQAWAARKPIFGSDSTVVIVPRWRVQDIDTEEDWERAQLMAKYLLRA